MKAASVVVTWLRQAPDTTDNEGRFPTGLTKSDLQWRVKGANIAGLPDPGLTRRRPGTIRK